MESVILQVPFDCGRRGERLGRGPRRLLEGLGELRTSEEIDLDDRFPTEVGSAIELSHRLAGRVAAVRREGRLPVVLAGNCSTALGAVAGLGPADTGVLWLDAHGDFNTPETSPSGYFDGMSLAVLVGRCWRAVATTIGGFVPVDEGRVVLLGARDLDPEEEGSLEGSAVRRLSIETVREEGAAAVGAAVAALRQAGASRLYLHLDLDVLDPEELTANPFAAPGGLRADEVLAVVRAAVGALPLGALAVTAYDPELDPAGRAVELLSRVLEEIGAAR